jgi:putative oxidoreductase
MLDKLAALRKRALTVVDKVACAGPLLARVSVGLVFASTGWGKLHNLEGVTKFFTELHLPAPAFQAGLVATTEFVGGLCILVGLLTRLAAVPLATTMIVAILTAKRGDLEGVTSLFGLEEWTYLVVFVWLALAGPGAISIDRLIGRRLDRIKR